MEITTNSPMETEELGKRLALHLVNENKIPSFISLFGEMGVGKTAFVRGFCSALNTSGVKSPTYTIVNEYRRGDFPIFHFDMYRVESEDDLISIGFYDYLEQKGFCLCEWSENITEFIPDDALTVNIARTQNSEEQRIITLKEIESL